MRLALCLVGLAVLVQFNTFAIALGFGSVGIVLIYPLMKRVTFWPQAVLGLAFSYGALMGWAAYWGDLALAPIVLYAASIAWTIGYDTIYAHQDKEDDILVGLKSTALRFGNDTPAWLTLFFGITIGGWLSRDGPSAQGHGSTAGSPWPPRTLSGRWRRSISTIRTTASTAFAATISSAPSCSWPS